MCGEFSNSCKLEMSGVSSLMITFSKKWSKTRLWRVSTSSAQSAQLCQSVGLLRVIHHQNCNETNSDMIYLTHTILDYHKIKFLRQAPSQIWLKLLYPKSNFLSHVKQTLWSPPTQFEWTFQVRPLSWTLLTPCWTTQGACRAGLIYVSNLIKEKRRPLRL